MLARVFQVLTLVEANWTTGSSQEWRVPGISLMKPVLGGTPSVITEELSVTISLKGQGPGEYQSQAFQSYEHKGSQKIFDVLGGRWAGWGREKTLLCHCPQQSVMLVKLRGSHSWSHSPYLIFVPTSSWWECLISSLMLGESDTEFYDFPWKRKTLFPQNVITSIRIV